MADSNDGATEAQGKTILRPIFGLTKGLSKEALEPIVVEAILKHRFLRDIAGVRHREVLRENNKTSEIAYIRAMIDAHAQQTVLSNLLDVLGYIPKVPDD